MQLEKRFVVLRWLRGSADWLEEKKEPNLSSLHRLPLVILVALELIHISFFRRIRLFQQGKSNQAIRIGRLKSCGVATH